MAKRARSQEAKEEKAGAILDMAAEMFATKEFERIKMSEIAKELGISNGILFVYFKTKEMLFFQLLMREYARRLENMEQRIEKADIGNYELFKKLVLEEMAVIIEDSDMYIRLVSIRGAILEKNIDLEVMIESKQWFYNRFKEVALIIYECCKVFKPDEIMEIFLVQESILVGCKLCSSLPKDVLNIIDKYQMEGFKFAFKDNALKTMSYYLDGMHQHD